MKKTMAMEKIPVLKRFTLLKDAEKKLYSVLLLTFILFYPNRFKKLNSGKKLGQILNKLGLDIEIPLSDSDTEQINFMIRDELKKAKFQKLMNSFSEEHPREFELLGKKSLFQELFKEYRKRYLLTKLKNEEERKIVENAFKKLEQIEMKKLRKVPDINCQHKMDQGVDEVLSCLDKWS